jgi:hypothetical protein
MFRSATAQIGLRSAKAQIAVERSRRADVEVCDSAVRGVI